MVRSGPAPQAQANTKPNPKDPGGHSAKGVEFAKKREYDKAVEEFSKAIEAEPQDAKNYFNRATAYRGLNKLTEAFNDYSKAIEMDAKNMAAYIGRGEVLLQQKQMDNALAMLVVVERFQGQGKQGGFFFGKHGGDLPFGGAVDTRIGAVGFPAVQISLRFFQALEAFSLEGCVLGVPDAALDFPLGLVRQLQRMPTVPKVLLKSPTRTIR